MSAARSSSVRAPPTPVGDSWAWIGAQRPPEQAGLGVGQAVELGGEVELVVELGRTRR